MCNRARRMPDSGGATTLPSSAASTQRRARSRRPPRATPAAFRTSPRSSTSTTTRSDVNSVCASSSRHLSSRISTASSDITRSSRPAASTTRTETVGLVSGAPTAPPRLPKFPRPMVSPWSTRASPAEAARQDRTSEKGPSTDASNRCRPAGVRATAVTLHSRRGSEQSLSPLEQVRTSAQDSSTSTMDSSVSPTICHSGTASPHDGASSRTRCSR